MSERYVVFDVETPNARNDRMSAIGVAVVEGCKIVSVLDTLINPECTFDPFHSKLTGIYPQDVVSAPTFPIVWDIIRPVFESGVLVAHNAQFDMGVLRKCLKHYGIQWEMTHPFACTVQMSRASYPELENHKLDTLCEYFKFDLDHHRAGSDSIAAARILIKCMKKGLEPKGFTKLYHFRRKEQKELIKVNGREDSQCNIQGERPSELDMA